MKDVSDKTNRAGTRRQQNKRRKTDITERQEICYSLNEIVIENRRCMYSEERGPCQTDAHIIPSPYSPILLSTYLGN